MLRESTKDESGEHKNFAIVSTVGKVKEMIEFQIIKNQRWRLFHGKIIYYSPNDKLETGDFWHYKDHDSMSYFAEAFHKRDSYKDQNEYRFLLWASTIPDISDQDGHDVTSQ